MAAIIDTSENRSTGRADTDNDAKDSQAKEEGGRARSAEISREKILSAALREFAVHGYDGATTASIARIVGVTQPLIHYHFGSKMALWRAVIDMSFAKLADTIEQAERDAQTTDPANALRMLAEHFIRFTAENREFVRVMFSEPAFDTPRMAWVADTHVAPLNHRAQEIIELAKTSGMVKKDYPTSHLILAFIGAAQFFFDAAPMVHRIYGIDPTSDEHIKIHANMVVDIFEAGIGLNLPGSN